MDRTPIARSDRPRVFVSLALVALAVGVSAYAYLVDRTAVSDGERAQRAAEVFPSFRIDEVRRIELARGPEAFVLERGQDDASAWFLSTSTRPTLEPADVGAVDSFLRELELAPRIRDLPGDVRTGMDTPRVSARIVMGSTTYSLVLGADATRPPGSAYMRLAGGAVFVVEPTLKQQLLKPSEAYRQRSLVGLALSDIARVDVTSAGATWGIERAGMSFRVGSVDGLRASRADVDRILGALVFARAETFVDDVATPDSELSVRVRSSNAKIAPTRFVLGKACEAHPNERLAVRTTPTLLSACVADTLAEALRANADTLVDRNVVSAHADEIEEIHLESLASRDRRFDWARRATGWHERTPDDRELDPEEAESVNALAEAMASADAVHVRPALSTDAWIARTRATLVRTGTAIQETIELGPTDSNGHTVARRGEDRAILALSPAVARLFEPHPIALRRLALWQAPFDVEHIQAIGNGCGPTPFQLDVTDGHWKLRVAGRFGVDTASAIALADALEHARAQRWASEADDGTFGLSRPSACSVTVRLAAYGSQPARTVALTLSASQAGVRYGRTSESPAIFVLGDTLGTALRALPIDRSLLSVDPLGTSEIAVLCRGGRRTVRLDSRAPKPASDPDARLVSALSRFGASDVLHLGPAGPDEGFSHPLLVLLVQRSAASGAPASTQETRIVVGALRSDDDASYFARVAALDATFAVPRKVVDAVLAAF